MLNKLPPFEMQANKLHTFQTITAWILHHVDETQIWFRKI